MKSCKKYSDTLPDLLLDPEQVSDEVKLHVAACDGCRADLQSLQATMSMMDIWQAPEPSPYFNTSMAAKLREERKAAPAGWYELLRARMQFLPMLQLRPLLAGALATAIMIGGGAFAGLKPLPGPQSAAVSDLRIMDRNDKALQQMDQLLQADNDTDASTGTTADTGANP